MRAYLEHAETVTGERPNLFRSDGGGEYGSKEFEAYFKSKGIHHKKMNAYTPQENCYGRGTPYSIFPFLSYRLYYA